MIAYSDKHTFEAVLVYRLDRFARNRYDSAINNSKLKKPGVRVTSARENISDDASGILVEGVLRVWRNTTLLNSRKRYGAAWILTHRSFSAPASNPGLEFTVDADRQFHVDSQLK